MPALGDSYGAVTIGTSAALIKGGRTSRGSLLIQNAHATNVLYIGFDSSVATTTGIRLSPDDSIEISDSGTEIYGIASGASTDVRFQEFG